GTKKIRTHNRMLANYPGTDGLKTGYTHASGFNIVISVERNGDRLIGVVFGGNTAASRDRHMEKLLDQSFAVLDERREEQARAREAIIESAPPLRLVGETSRFDGSWGIQIGAYQSIDAATRALQFANHKIPDLLAPAGPALVPIEHNGHTLYRARYLGLDPDQAKGACRHLAGSAIPCFVVRQSEEDKTLALTSS
ncbi:MAG: SPOR domain-containing protein, partial [Alphaproteobacteria bacterium]